MKAKVVLEGASQFNLYKNGRAMQLVEKTDQGTYGRLYGAFLSQDVVNIRLIYKQILNYPGQYRIKGTYWVYNLDPAQVTFTYTNKEGEQKELLVLNFQPDQGEISGDKATYTFSQEIELTSEHFNKQDQIEITAFAFSKSLINPDELDLYIETKTLAPEPSPEPSPEIVDLLTYQVSEDVTLENFDASSTSSNYNIYFQANGTINTETSNNIYAVALADRPEELTEQFWVPEDGDYSTNLLECKNNVYRYLELPEEEKENPQYKKIFANSLVQNLHFGTCISQSNKSFSFNDIQIHSDAQQIKEKYKKFLFWFLPKSDLEDFDSITKISIRSQVCLSGDTLISMADSSTKRLDSLKRGDEVLDSSGKPSKIIALKSNGFNSFYILYRFENGIEIKEVFPHRFYNEEKGFWEHLSKWKIGDHARAIDGTKVALISKEIVYEREEGFGLFTESGSYYANGLLSGPARCNKNLLSNKTLKEAVSMACSIRADQAYNLLQIEGINNEKNNFLF